MSPSKGATLAPFRNRRFLYYWLTGLSANFGWLIQMVGASWLMTSLGGTADQVALVQTSVALPIMLFSLMAGAVADSLGRRSMVIWSQCFLLIVSVTLAVCAYFELLTPWSLLALTFLIGTGKALNNPGWQTMVTELVPREDLPPAIALNSVAFNIARSVGPAIGGVIVAVVGAFAAFVVNAASNIGVIFVASRWPATRPSRDLPPENIGGAMMAGLRYVSMSPNILIVMLRSAVFNFAAISVMALMPLVALDLLDGGPQVFGLLLGAFGVGAIGGAFWGARLRQTLSLEWLVRAGFIGFAIATGVMAVSTSIPLSLLASAAAGVSWLLTQSTFNTSIQLSSPRWVLSRCHAIYQSCGFGGNALGSWVWGLVAGAYGVSTALAASCLALVLGAMLGRIFALKELDIAGLDIDAPWTRPDVSLDLLPKSGPIITTIEYRILPDDVPAFLSVMAERRRARIRDGARLWTLSRDIQNPEIWFERFKAPTWVEAQRLRARRTVASAAVSQRIHDLHQGDRPKVSYELSRQPAAATGHSDDMAHPIDH